MSVCLRKTSCSFQIKSSEDAADSGEAKVVLSSVPGWFPVKIARLLQLGLESALYALQVG